MMEAEIGRTRLSDNRIRSSTNRTVLILNWNSAPCTADQRNSLLYLIQKFLNVKSIVDESSSYFRFPDTLPAIPDPTLKAGIGEAAQDLVESCQEQGNVSFFNHKLEHFVKLKFIKIGTESLL